MKRLLVIGCWADLGLCSEQFALNWARPCDNSSFHARCIRFWNTVNNMPLSCIDTGSQALGTEALHGLCTPKTDSVSLAVRGV